MLLSGVAPADPGLQGPAFLSLSRTSLCQEGVADGWYKNLLAQEPHDELLQQKHWAAD